MNPNDIVLENLSKSFEFVKACKELDNIDDIEDLRNISKAYMKLYMKQQEVLSIMFGKTTDKYS
jgi:hypothetical protein